MPSPPAALLEMLPLHAVDALDAAEVTELERALAVDPALARELARHRESVAALAADLTPVSPAAGVRARVLASIDAGATPRAAPGATTLGRFAAQVAELFAVTIDAARGALARLGDGGAWRPLLPGIDCIVVSGGSDPTQPQCAFVRIAPGTTFPWHHHLGEERSLVLQGGAHLCDGRDLRPGDLLVVDEAVEHDFVVEGGEPCIFAVRSGGMRPGRRRQ